MIKRHVDRTFVLKFPVASPPKEITVKFVAKAMINPVVKTQHPALAWPEARLRAHPPPRMVLRRQSPLLRYGGRIVGLSWAVGK